VTFRFVPFGEGVFVPDPIDAMPIIPISDESFVRHESDEVFWFVYDPESYWDGWSDPWVCFGSWLKEIT